MSEKISIIIPCYNDGENLTHLLNTIFEQTYNNYEILLIDGGSTDCTLEVYEKKKSRIDIFISENDNGIFDAMNKGINLSTGEWLFFIGCDDRLFSKKVFENIFLDKEYKCIDILYGKIFNVSKNQIVGNNITEKENLLTELFWHQAIFYRKKTFTITGLYQLKYKIAADTILNMDAYCRYNLKWEFIDHTITKYSGDGLSSTNIDLDYHADQKRLYFEWFSGIKKKKIYEGLQHHLYSEIKNGSLVKAMREYFEIVWKSKNIIPITYNSLYWLKQRIKNK